MNTRVRSMKARRTGGTCRGCKRLIILGDIITRHNGRWLCTDCATTAAKLLITMTQTKELPVPGVTRIVDAIVAVGTETTVTHYVSVRCGKCRTEFNTSANFRTAACKRCGRVCRLDLADRIPDALPSNVIPIARSRAS